MRTKNGNDGHRSTEEIFQVSLCLKKEGQQKEVSKMRPTMQKPHG